MIRLLQRVWKSFGFAVKGMVKTFKSELMFRFYTGCYVLMTAISLVIRLPFHSFLLLIACWSGVLSFELINTGVEKAIDATKIHNDLTAFAKDAAAGSVALFGVTSGVVTIATWVIHIMN